MNESQASPVPTPYDITDIPLIPWEPGIKALFVVVAIGCIIWLLLQSHLRKNVRIDSIKDPKKLLTKLIQQAKQYSSKDLKLTCSLLSLGVKRLLSLTEGAEFAALTPQELHDNPNSNPALRQIAQSLKDLESLNYSKDISLEQFKVIFEKIIPQLEGYVKGKRL